jgi:hypothetical protein
MLYNAGCVDAIVVLFFLYHTLPMNQTKVEQERISASIAAIKAGNPDKARALLQLAIVEDPENDRAWQWLAVVADSAEEQRRCLYRALSINPSNQVAQEALEQMLGQEHALIPTRPTSTPVPAVFQPIVYYDRPSPHRLSSYILATFLFCVTGLGFTLVIMGSLLPWATVSGVKMAALEQEGYVTLITGVVGILMAAVGIWRSGCLSLLASVASISFALVAIGVSAYHVFSIAEPDVSPGLGFVFVLLGGMIAMLSSVVNSFSGLTMLSFAMRE